MNSTAAARPLAARFDAYWRLMRFDKPIGILLLLWPGLWALWIAGQGRPAPYVVFVIVAGTVLMRAAGCVINDYADRDFDPHVARTKLRPIAAGEVQPKEALWLFVVLCLVAFGLVLTMNGLTIALSVPGALLAASYPYMKRYTYLPQAYLGLAFGWAVPMSFAAETGGIAWIAWEIYAATILWALVYDTMYAMVDRDDDLKIGVKSTASPANTAAPNQLLFRNAWKHAGRARSRISHCWYSAKPKAATSPKPYAQPKPACRPTATRISSMNACSKASSARSNSPNRIAVDLTPIFRSSSRSTMAYMVS